MLPIKQILLLSLLCLVSFFNSNKSSAQTNQYFDGSSTFALTASRWATSCTPGTSAFTSGNIANFCTVNGTGSGAVGITVGGITATENYTHSSPSGTLATGGNVVTVDVSAGKVFNLGAASISTAAGTGFKKTGGGAYQTAGGAFTGGFTLDAGTMLLGGVNAMGAGGALTLNSGTVAGTATRNLTGKYPSGITIAGDIKFGELIANFPTIGNDAANLTFSDNVSLGSTTRALTIGNNGTHTFAGVLSGSAGITVGATGSGLILLSGTNTYTGLTTVSGGTLQLNKAGGTTIPNSNDVTISGGTLKVTSNQTVANLTLSSGTLTVDAGVTLTITGTYNATGGTISNSGTIKLNGGATNFPGSGVTVNNGTAGTMTNLEIATSSDVTITGGFTISGTLTLTSGKVILGTNDLTIGSAGTITGATGAKYIVTDGSGSLIRNAVTSAKAYPVGDASYYTPVTITNSGTSDNFSVNMTSSSAPICLTTAPFSDINAVTATWNIAEASAGGSNCTLVIDYGSVSTGGSYNSSAAQIAHCNGTVVDYKNGSVTGTVATGSGFTTFSPFGISSDANLPIELVRFTGLARTGETLLAWQTATESNNDHFSIQRSTNSQDFTEIGQVKGAGTSYEPQDYTFTDEHPLQGKNYYRLKQVDFDGKFSYSPVVTTTFGKAHSMTLAPLPATETLRIQLDKGLSEDGLWQVFDMNGRLLLSGKMIAETKEQSIHIAELPEGAYALRLTVGQEVMVEQFRKH